MKDNKTKSCINPWLKFLSILCLAVLTLSAIYGIQASSKNTKRKIENALTFRENEKDYQDNILIASSGINLQSDIAVQFETCQCFIVTNPSTSEFISFSNSSNSFNQRKMEKFIRDNNIEAVITGTMYMDTYQMLDSSNVEIFTGVTGSAENALNMYNKHDLISSKIPNQIKRKVL